MCADVQIPDCSLDRKVPALFVEVVASTREGRWGRVVAWLNGCWGAGGCLLGCWGRRGECVACGSSVLFWEMVGSGGEGNVGEGRRVGRRDGYR